MRYAIWNNKGGVGKSFLTFIFATEYAETHPEKIVCVVDMCPQANVSEIFLGGNGNGASVLNDILSMGAVRQTIGGYFDSRIIQPHAKTGTESTVLVEPHNFNHALPGNMLLVAGDPSLEVQTEAINQIANQSLPRESWRNVHSWLSDLCSVIESRYPDTTFFIDCNPSFAAYTALSIVAADSLIVPCSADGSSARAISNLGQLVYGHNAPPQYNNAMFSARLRTAGLVPPSIAMVILNRSTQYNEKASKAFEAMFDEIKKRATSLLASEPRSRGNRTQEFFYDIPDTHSVAIVSSHTGLPIHRLEMKKYEVFGENPQVNLAPLERYRDAIATVVRQL